MFWQLLANGLVTGSVIAIAAVGVSLVYGILRLVNFAYGDFMAFGALAAYAFNGPLGLGMVVSTLLAMLATAVLSLGLDVVLWRPLRARRAGFMSLFLASIGLALVLRQVLLLAYGPQPHTYRVNQYKVYVIGSVRLSQAQVITILVASARDRRGRPLPLALDGRPDDARAVRRPGARGDRGHRRRPRDRLHVDPLRPARRARRRARRARRDDASTRTSASRSCCRSSRQSILGGIGNAYGALVGGLVLGVAMELSTWPALLGGVDPVYKPVVAFAVLIAALMVRPQGLFGRARVV